MTFDEIIYKVVDQRYRIQCDSEEQIVSCLRVFVENGYNLGPVTNDYFESGGRIETCFRYPAYDCRNNFICLFASPTSRIIMYNEFMASCCQEQEMQEERSNDEILSDLEGLFGGV